MIAGHDSALSLNEWNTAADKCLEQTLKYGAMEIEDVLSLGTEVGAALVAISGLIATLNLQNNREIEKPVFNLLSMVLITSGCLTVFSYAPLVLHPLFSSDESMWCV